MPVTIDNSMYECHTGHSPLVHATLINKTAPDWFLLDSFDNNSHDVKLKNFAVVSHVETIFFMSDYPASG